MKSTLLNLKLKQKEGVKFDNYKMKTFSAAPNWNGGVSLGKWDEMVEFVFRWVLPNTVADWNSFQ
jgi:hypothetical protein